MSVAKRKFGLFGRRTPGPYKIAHSINNFTNQNFRNTDGIIFVLDSADYRSFEQARIGMW